MPVMPLAKPPKCPPNWAPSKWNEAQIEPGVYRTITGAESVPLGLLAGSQLAGLNISFCSYPITPASALLHQLARMKNFGVVTFQAEDEIAAAAAALGASYAGSLGVTSSSGPGIALKMEAIGLAIGTELPMVDRELAARRALDRSADKNRTVGSLSGSLRPQRGRADAGDFRVDALRRV